jgi:hypothetical protein
VRPAWASSDAPTVSLGTAGHAVSRLIAGSNIEVGEEVIFGLVSERLRNPRFVGPANPLSGAAPEWSILLAPGRSARSVELTSGLSLSGGESQFLGQHAPGFLLGLAQRPVEVKAGEKLELELWALAQNPPVEMVAGIRPAASGATPSARAVITLTAPYWRRYRAVLEPDASDATAEFYIQLLGRGAAWIDQVHLRDVRVGLRADTETLIRRLAPPVLRFPGGCASTVYKWRHGVGPAERRPVDLDPIWMGRIDHSFGTDEYLALCDQIGALPHITVGIGNGTLDDAADWAAHVLRWFREQGKEPPPAYFQIGNEPWAHWEIGSTSAVQYASLVSEWAPRIRTAYPGCRIVVAGQAARLDDMAEPSSGDQWRRVLIERCSADFDVLALQLYSKVHEWDTDADAYLARTATEARATLAQLEEALADAALAGSPKSVALTEWNLWAEASSPERGYREPGDGAHVVYAATILNGLIRLGPRIELANHYSLLNWFGAIQTTRSTAQMTAMGVLLGWYCESLPATYAPAEWSGERPEFVDALGLVGDDASWLYVVNASGTRSATFRLADEPAGQGAAQMLAAPHPLMLPSESAWNTATGELTIPPCSVTRIKW